MRRAHLHFHITMNIVPPLEEVKQALAICTRDDKQPKLAPVVAVISGEFHTPTGVYLKLLAQSVSQHL